MPVPVPDSSILRVLRLLEASPRLTQREMARELGVSLGKANYCLRALIGKGFVKAQNFRNSTNKRAYFYLLTPEGVAAKAQLTRHFLARKREEYDALRVELEGLQRESEIAVGVDSAGEVESAVGVDSAGEVESAVEVP